MQDDHGKKLTLVEASFTITGIGVGGGVMAVPYLAAQNGLANILLIMVASYGLSVLLHLMIAELALRDGGDSQLVELFVHHVFLGKAGKIFLWAFFVLMIVGFFFGLSGYLLGSAQIAANLTGLPLSSSILATYLLAAGVVFFGLKAVGMLEKYAIVALAVILAALAVCSFGKEFHPVPLFTSGTREAMALYGMVMFCFACMWSVPQAVTGLSWKPKLVPWAVVIGIGTNFCFVLVITLASVLVSEEVTKIAITGWTGALGGWAVVLGSGAIFLAMITSYWATSHAFAVILQERLGWGQRLSWLISTLPTLAIAISGVMGFLGFMRITGGAIALMLGLLVPPALRHARRAGGPRPVFDLGVWGGKYFRIFLVIAYILMAAGSLVHVE